MSNRKKDSVEIQQRRIDTLLELVNAYPTVPSYQRQLAYAHTDISHGMRGLGQFEEAEKHAGTALQIRKQVAAEYPDPLHDQYNLSHAYHWLGAVLEAENKLQEAEESYRKTLELRQQLVAQNPDSYELQTALAAIKEYLGNVLRSQGKAQAAEHQHREAIEIVEGLVRDFPNHHEYLDQLNHATQGLGLTLMAMGRIEEAEKQMRRSLALAEKWIADFPGAGQTGHNAIGIDHFNLGVLLFAKGSTQEAADQFREALDVFERQMVRDPTLVSERAALAYLLVACPASQFRDAGRAIQLSKSCLQHAPGMWSYWRTLGMAQYLAGDAAGAIRSLTTAMRGSEGGDATMWFFMAMAHSQADRKNEAQQWYERAARWMDDHQPQDVYLSLLRAETEDLMGIQQLSENVGPESRAGQDVNEMEAQTERVETEN